MSTIYYAGITKDNELIAIDHTDRPIVVTNHDETNDTFGVYYASTSSDVRVENGKLSWIGCTCEECQVCGERLNPYDDDSLDRQNLLDNERFVVEACERFRIEVMG